ncbi:MAG: extracellular solute-binding protein [Burkholderiaceae bacterium]
MNDRRQFLRSATAAGAVGLGWPMVGSAASDWDATMARAKEKGEVTIYSSGVARQEEPRMAAFSRASGVKVNYSRPGGGEIVIRKFGQEVQNGAPLADVCTLTDYALGLHAQNQGWTDTVSLPNEKELGERFAKRDAGLIPLGGFGLVIVINEKMMKVGDAPQSYADLADPKFKGQILFGAPENAGSTTLLIKGLVEQYGWDYVKQLRANEVAEMRLQAEAMQAVARGEKPICVVAQAWGYLYKKQGAPTQMIFPADGMVLAQTCMFVARNAPHPDGGRVLVNHMISAEYQISSQATGTYPANRNTPLAEGIPSLDAIKIYEPNLAELVATRGEVIDNWRRIMS